jgi:hypothetical protein
MGPTIVQNGRRLYGLAVTRDQIERVADLNQRFGENLTIGDHVDYVVLDDGEADMIVGNFGGLTIGILPDGSAHS